MTGILMQLGAVVFRIAPLGLQEIDHTGTASFAAHQVVGDMPPLEFTGEGPETWSIHATLLPEFSARAGAGDGAADLDALHAMRKSGAAQFLMRGDGVPMGWVVILRVSERSRRLNAAGVGREIEVSIDVKRAQTPDASSAVLLSLMPAGL